MAHYLVDTDVMIDVSRRSAAAASYVDSLDDVTISIITAHGLIVGARNQRDAEGIDSLIKTYPVQATWMPASPAAHMNCSSATHDATDCGRSMP